ncbi:hypothetical protein U1Q18_029274 [Sarracenia purpurea var. burkii]
MKGGTKSSSANPTTKIQIRGGFLENPRNSAEPRRPKNANSEDEHGVGPIDGIEEPLNEAIAETLNLGLIKSREGLFVTSRLWCSGTHRACSPYSSKLHRLRLRRPNNDWDFIPVDQILHTAPHELRHDVHGPQNASCYKF